MMNDHSVAMVVFSYYPLDTRVRREAEALVEAGMSVDVICLKDDGELPKETVNGVSVHRINLKRKRYSKLRYICQWSYFIIAAALKLSWLHLFKSYHLVHIHNMPDFLVMTALLPKLTGAKTVLDLHDPMPEVYMTKYSMDEFHPVIRLLRFFEKWSIRFADLVITPNISFRNLFISRDCPAWKIQIVMNSPQEDIFKDDTREHQTGQSQIGQSFSIMYHGFVAEQNGLDTAIEAVAKAKKEIPDLMFHVYGDGDFLKEIKKQVKEFNLKNIVRFYGHVPLEEISSALSSIDIGIIPNKMTCFTNLNFPVRVFEYLIMNKPVIVPRTQGIQDYFEEESMIFFEAGNPNDLANKIIEAYKNPLKRKDITKRGRKVFHRYSWQLQKTGLVNMLKTVIETGSFRPLQSDQSQLRGVFKN
jgi:glycosyltransferase involved in cell wall biosynthesis